MKSKKLTFQQHSDNGQRMRQAWSSLMEARRVMGANLNKSARSLRLIDKTINQLNSLRTELDTQIGRDCPGVDNDALNHVYFGFRLEGQE